MEASFLSPPTKRALSNLTGMHEPKSHVSNGSSFKRGRSKPPPPPLSVPAGHVAFRLLCHASRAGGIIGKSGTIIRQLQLETGAKIRIEDSVSDSDERVILVIAPNILHKKIVVNNSSSSGDDEKYGVEQFDVSPAQEALLRVFERVLDVAAETDGIYMGAGGVVSCRLLAESFQVGSVIGRGGKVVEKIRKDSSCKIKVLTPDNIASFAAPDDEIVEIEGDSLGVKKALILVSRRLQDCPPVDKTRNVGNASLPAIPLDPLPPHLELPHPVASSSVTYASVSDPYSMEADRDTRTQHQEMIYRILCSSDTAGGVIGKGGSIVRALQNETGASISVGPSLPECEERLITVTASENPESQYSPAQNAVVLVFTRAVEAGIEKGVDSGVRGSPVTARLVIPSNQVGCVMGKGGTIVSEIRKATGAGIRILGNDQVPKCASDNDSVVQIAGDFPNVQDALYHITGRLRDNHFPNQKFYCAGPGSTSSIIHEQSPYGRGRGTAPFGLHPSVSASRRHDNTFTRNMDHLGLPQSLDQPPSPKLWTSVTTGGLNSRSVMDIGRGLMSFKGGLELGSGSKSAIVTNTTVEIVVPEDVMCCVYGENGSNLARLRQISSAKVIVRAPNPGKTERTVVISGTPDETQAAQSLLQAFILTGTS